MAKEYEIGKGKMAERKGPKRIIYDPSPEDYEIKVV
jgi:hypothetical protein